MMSRSKETWTRVNFCVILRIERIARSAVVAINIHDYVRDLLPGPRRNAEYIFIFNIGVSDKPFQYQAK